MAQIKKRFAYNFRRRFLFQGLTNVLRILEQANCKKVFLNGSFITRKEEPGDYDLCWEPIGVLPTPELRSLLVMTSSERRLKFGGDILMRLPQPPFQIDYVDYWQTDVQDNLKGIIRIDLEETI
jgi:hypothetical protein